METEVKLMHVTLVNPPYPAGAHHHAPFIPLGLLYLAAVLEENKVDVDIIDCQASHLSLEKVHWEIEKRKPDVLGVTSTTLTYKSALKVVKLAKEVNPEVYTILGGPHATFWDENALRECKQLDCVARGEGEGTIIELVQCLRDKGSLSKILGITYRKGEEIVRTPDRPLIENLDELPFPAYHLMPIEELRKSGELIFPIITSRGCAFWCDFCTAVRMFGRKYRTRSPRKVVDDVERLVNEFAAEEVTFCDDIFTLDQARAEAICREIQRRRLKVRWTCGTRVDMVSKELLRLMRDAGCVGIWFGVESGAQQMLDEMHKGISLEQTIQAFKWAREAGLRTLAQVILGYPGETRETMLQTIKFVEKISPDEVGWYNVATPFPGTPLYEIAEKNGWIKVRDFDKYDTVKPVIETPWLSMKDLRKTRELAFARFYLRPAYLAKVFAKSPMRGIRSLAIGLAHFWNFIKL